MVAGLALAAGLLLAPLDAAACSCVPIDPWEAYARSDAAIVGVFLGKRGPTTYLFRVEEDYKTDLPAEVEVKSAEYGASCGIEARVGQRLGLFLSRDGEQWSSNLCSQARPAQVRIAAKGLPKPNGRGPIRFLVGGSFGPARVQALDAAGRTLAYGRGEGKVSALAVCPGSRRSVEVTGPRLGVRDLRSFRLLKEVAIQLRGEYAADVHCHGRDAFAALVGEERTRLVRIRGRNVKTIRLAGQPAVAFSGRYAYLSTRTRIFALDLGSGATRTLADFTGDQLAVSPDGTLLAALTGNRLVVIRLRGRPAVLQGPFLTKQSMRLVWDRHRLAVIGWEEGEVYDERLRLQGRLPSWGVSDAVGIGGRIAGVGYGGLRVARLPRGPVRLLRDLVSPNTFAIAAVDGGPNIRLAGSVRCARG
jgi:hypothetical protein